MAQHVITSHLGVSQGGYCGRKPITFPVSFTTITLNAGFTAFTWEAGTGYIPGNYYSINQSVTLTGFSFGVNASQWWVAFGV